MYLLQLSKEHTSLPFAEARAVIHLSGSTISGRGEDYVIATKPFNWSRLALTHQVIKVSYSGDAPEKAARGIRARSTFAVRTGNSTLDKTLGKKISRFGKVKLANPEQVFMGVWKDRFYFGELVFDRPSFESRKVQNRPFFHPTSLHPKYARCLVNLSQAKEGERLLDPFCGTGGILIEAGLVGAFPVGVDVSLDMVNGSRNNLKHCGIEKYNVSVGDARNLDVAEVDAVATDPPYGRSSSFTGDALQDLYQSSLRSIHSVLRDGGTAAIVVPETVNMEQVLPPLNFQIQEQHFDRVHKSLNRVFYVLKKT